jgi:hypothetical protein
MRAEESRRVARSLGGHYMDQFTYAERATDWRGNTDIAASVFAQLRLERHPVPEWIVVGAGTGGTAVTFGRYLRCCGPDPAVRGLLCDRGDRYADSYYDDGWVRAHDLDPEPHLAALRRALDEGGLRLPQVGPRSPGPPAVAVGASRCEVVGVPRRPGRRPRQTGTRIGPADVADR